MTDGIQYLGKFLIVLGVIVIAVGGLLLLSGKIPYIGRLPGDILIQKKNYTFYFPLATSIIISLIITLVFWLLGRR
jgi:ribose/xylose/arabinose/galactoside ABC-type transport system permease subunit